MNYGIDEILKITGGQLLNDTMYKDEIGQIVYDSRRIQQCNNTMFIAIQSNHNDGHNYIKDAWKKGIRNFLVSRQITLQDYPDSNFIHVDNTIESLQSVARYHRNRFSIPVIAITGSNGKTVVKEWLSSCLAKKYRVASTPLSYNSQIGVPLSVLSLNKSHDIAVFEAGISLPGEMKSLGEIIVPDIGIFTNIGDAHGAGFGSRKEKLDEKIILFGSCRSIIYNKDQKEVDEALSSQFHNENLFSWGIEKGNPIQFERFEYSGEQSRVWLKYQHKLLKFSLPFRHRELVENCMHVISFLLLDNWQAEEIQVALNGLSSLPHRLQIKDGINNSLLVNDSYSLDLASLRLALEYQDLYSRNMKKIIFLSDFEQQTNRKELMNSTMKLLQEHSVEECIAIGFEGYTIASDRAGWTRFESTEDCIENYDFDKIRNSCVLIKGARKYHMEDIFARLSPQVHETILETDLGAIAHNLRVYRSMIKTDTRLLPVIKAEAYGSGSVRLAHFLESRKIDCIAVAIVDEAIRIRKSGCKLDIIVLNVQESNPELLWKYGLEPEVYSMALLRKLAAHSNKVSNALPIHLKIDTGMHRLGFIEADFEELIELAGDSPFLKVKSIFSHLAASGDERHDAFTREQIQRFEKYYKTLSDGLGIKPWRHILNTGGIIRFNESQYEMVRIGLGLYGIDETGDIQAQLEVAHSLKSRVLQIKQLKKGESTAYNRSFIAEKEIRIAIIAIGYADGLMRRAGDGKFSVRIHNKYYPIIGNICMDVSMVNIGDDTTVNEGDEVVIFDGENSVKDLARTCGTISYEIISRIAPRVKRLYIHQ